MDPIYTSDEQRLRARAGVDGAYPVDPPYPVAPAVPAARVLAAGDVVQLKSGGPSMTVVGIGTDGKVACKWFGANAESPVDHIFGAECLGNAK